MKQEIVGDAIDDAMDDEEDALRSCFLCPGWAPRLRAFPGFSRRDGGLTKSDEGGLDDVADVFLAAAN